MKTILHFQDPDGNLWSIDDMSAAALRVALIMALEEIERAEAAFQIIGGALQTMLDR